MKKKEKTNKTEQKFYEMVYECENCGSKNFKQIPFGEPAPIDPELVCTYCGCDSFYAPRKPKAEDYTK